MTALSNIAADPAQLTLKSGKAIVIATGSVIPFREQDIEIGFTLHENRFVIVLNQTADTTRPEARWEISTQPEHPQRAVVRMINIHNSPISGIPEPLRLWTSPATAVYLQLRHVMIAGVGTVFHFTIYLSPESQQQFETPSTRPTRSAATA